MQLSTRRSHRKLLRRNSRHIHMPPKPTRSEGVAAAAGAVAAATVIRYRRRGHDDS